MMNKLEIENGKYQIENNDGIVKVYRYGELWLSGASISKLELCLIQHIEELEQQNKRYQEAIERALGESKWGDEGNALHKIISILAKALEVNEQ